MRKPRPLNQKPGRGSYAGLQESAYEYVVYIGGDYYGAGAQIHLFADELRPLANWILKADAYLKQRRKKGGKR